MKPFVKWVGGKRKVIDEYLSKYLPSNFDKYIEPFVGGGAMFMHLKHKANIINDINSELITAYNTIKYKLSFLCDELDKLMKLRDKENYYKIRSEIYSDDVKIAARFIYLNKLGFNGMYRVNSKGIFNIPYNNSKNANLYEKENLVNINLFLNNNSIEIMNTDFEKVIDKSKEGDFIFCDPPYDYEEGENGFKSYSSSGFSKDEQKRLFLSLQKAHHKGTKWMMTNHQTKLINDLYKDFNIINITTDRFINSDASKRKRTGKEVIVTNYEI